MASRVTSDLAGPPHKIITDSGLYYLGSDPLVGNAAYALRTRRGIVVVDPGWNFARLQAAFDSLALRIQDVRIILVTHLHGDHWFCARELVEKSGARVMAHAQEAPMLMKPADTGQYFSSHSPTDLGPYFASHTPVIPSVRALQDGDVVELGEFKIEVIATPGHTRGSVCYRTTVRGYQVLWSGDTVESLTAESLGGVYMTRLGPSFGGDMRSYLASLRRLDTIAVDVLLPGHPLSNYVGGTRVDPGIGTHRWKELLRPNAARIEMWLNDYPQEVDEFLDGTAKTLTSGILYLGEVDSVATYILRTEEGLACIDPGRRSLEDLRSQMNGLGAAMGDLKLVLLTAIHPDHSALAPDLCAETGAALVCGPIAGAREQDLHLLPDRVLSHGDEVQLGKTSITALAGPRSGGADLSYLVQTSDKWVLFGGDTFGRFLLPVGVKHHEAGDEAEPEDKTAIRESYRLMKQRPVPTVLPAHPRYHESPHYFPGEWRWFTARWRG